MHIKLEELNSLGEKNKDKISLFYIANVKNRTQNYNNYTNTSVSAEFLSKENFNRIINSFLKQGYDIHGYYDEQDFIRDCVLNDYFNGLGRQIIVINSAQKGTTVGRKSLIPAFCDYCNFWYVGSNPYISSLARDKFRTSCILEAFEIPCAKSYLYDSKTGWLLGKKPVQGQKVIAKLNYEASSIGLTEENCFSYDKTMDSFIDTLSKQYRQSVIVQNFIDGYEIEFPFIKSQSILPLLPVAISYNNEGIMGNTILTYELRKKRTYSFFNYQKINPEISKLLLECAIKVINCLDLNGLCRIDFRITKNNQFYVTDVATNPGYTEITSVRYAFSSLGFNYDQMLSILIGSVIKKMKENKLCL